MAHRTVRLIHTIVQGNSLLGAMGLEKLTMSDVRRSRDTSDRLFAAPVAFADVQTARPILRLSLNLDGTRSTPVFLLPPSIHASALLRSLAFELNSNPDLPTPLISSPAKTPHTFLFLSPLFSLSTLPPQQEPTCSQVL